MNKFLYLFIIFFLILLSSFSNEKKEISYIQQADQSLEMVTSYKEGYEALEKGVLLQLKNF